MIILKKDIKKNEIGYVIVLYVVKLTLMRKKHDTNEQIDTKNI